MNDTLEFYCERSSLNCTNKSCKKGLKYWKFKRERNKAKQVMKKFILKDNIVTKYTECKHKNNELFAET